MSFGYSVGDFLALLKLANDLRKQFQDAPAQYKDVSNESVSIMRYATVYADSMIDKFVASRNYPTF
jgi:hypothetical protein